MQSNQWSQEEGCRWPFLPQLVGKRSQIPFCQTFWIMDFTHPLFRGYPQFPDLQKSKKFVCCRIFQLLGLFLLQKNLASAFFPRICSIYFGFWGFSKTRRLSCLLRTVFPAFPRPYWYSFILNGWPSNLWPSAAGGRTAGWRRWGNCYSTAHREGWEHPWQWSGWLWRTPCQQIHFTIHLPLPFPPNMDTAWQPLRTSHFQLQKPVLSQPALYLLLPLSLNRPEADHQARLSSLNLRRQELLQTHHTHTNLLHALWDKSWSSLYPFQTSATPDHSFS